MDITLLEHFMITPSEPGYSYDNSGYKEAIDIAAIHTSNTLRKAKLTGLILDETGVEKKLRGDYWLSER